MAETFTTLELEYCPPIDPALLSAILSDYDLDNQEDVRNARTTLDSLKEDALLEEVAGFDASGTGGAEDAEEREQRGVSKEGTSTSQSQFTDIMSVSNHLSSLEMEDHETGIEHADPFSELDEETKIQLLQDVFGEHVSAYTIRYTLQKCGGKWHAAMEELLNHAYLAEAGNGEEGISFTAKGIEGFAEDGLGARGRRGKKMNKHRKFPLERRSSSLSQLPDSPSAEHVTNIWHSRGDPTTASKDSPSSINIIPVYARPNIESESETPLRATSRPQSHSAVTSRTASIDRTTLAVLRAQALSQAHAARRKAKSDHLMSGAAAYYSDVSRSLAAETSAASARAADALAASQSSATEVDLHGIDVRNGVRIAKERAEEWWMGLGESRVNGRLGAGEREGGFRVVVGMGRHSEGGNSKLGPAVLKGLREEGWRVESVGGAVVVRGRVKR